MATTGKGIGRNRWVYFIAAAFIAAALIPALVGEFWVHVFTEILVLGLFAASFNLIFGYMGQLSFGHAAYYGVGAYTTGLLMVKAHWPLFLCLPASMITAGAVAAILGLFCVRLRGIYFAILTMAFGQLVFYIIFQWYSFTGGDNGLQGIVPPRYLLGADAYYYFVLLVVTAASIVLWLITESPFGYTMRAIRDNTERTEFIGINVQRYMLINFIVAGMFAGLAGAMWGPFNRSVAPDLAAWQHSGIPVFMAVLGGPHHFLGPMVGSVIYTFLNAFVTGFTEYWPLVSGLIIILVVLLMPGGLFGVMRGKGLFRRRASSESAARTGELKRG
ncbi:MAG: branched-chain amino acid ABC transporter permease [Syntrophorhabdales bacterium]|jgi:branched-chain amino acid transport system permease protein